MIHRADILKTLCVLLLTAAAAGVQAQERYESVVRHNAWNMGGGAAGLRCDMHQSAYAELYALKENGGFKPSYASSDSWNFGAQMRAVRHLSKVSFAGGFGFDYFTGRNMCGSMLSSPEYYPFDILEFTPGRKIRETYTFRGAVSAELGRGWLLGLSADLDAGSYSKRKDLRHKNNILDFDVRPSVTKRFSGGAVGLTYIFGKRGEIVSANEYGISSDTYDAFFDKGIFYGEQSLWTGNGIHLNYSGVSGFPLREYANGAMLQVSWRALYADVSYSRRSGRTGEKQTVWHEFTTDAVAAHAAVTLRGGWWLRGSFSCEGLTSDENVLNSVTEGGVTTDRKFGSNRIFARNGLEASFEGEYSDSRMEILFGGRWRSVERLSTLTYPLWRSHSMQFGELYVDTRWTLGRFELSVSVSGGAGSSREGGDGSSPEEYVQCRTDYLAAETEWYTAPRIGAGVGLRCNIRRFYVDLRGDYGRSLSASALGADRIAARLSAGYRF